MPPYRDPRAMKRPASRYVWPCLLALVACDSSRETSGPPEVAEPPFGGTIFIDPDIITPEDATTLVDVTPAGQGSRTMFDRRVNSWITVEAFLFDATFDDGLATEIQVNPEFGETAAAFVVLEDGAAVRESEIQEYCGRHLANEKIPATISFIPEIPRTPTGKILKRDLREMLRATPD